MKLWELLTELPYVEDTRGDMNTEIRAITSSSREKTDKGLFFDNAQMYDPKYGWWYYMRTPNVQYSFLQRVMTAYGSVSFTYANNDIVGIRPLINLSADTPVTDVGVEEMLYRIG